MSRQTIKGIAMGTMFLNHLAAALLPEGTLLWLLFTDIGYFTAITMCYFLAEGFSFTGSRKRYGLRLLTFALISQVPFQMAEGRFALNMMFTLLICLLLLTVWEKEGGGGLCRTPASAALLIASCFCDWPLLAPVFTWLFYRSRGDKKATARAYGLSMVLLAVFDCLNAVGTGNLFTAAGRGLLAAVGPAASGVVILLFYNGKQGGRGKAWEKWFFYLFYPAHLLVLGVLRIGMG